LGRGRNEVKKKNHLSKEEARKLIKQSQAGDEDARASLVEKNTRLVWNAVQRFKNRGYELDDLFQLGVIGLLKSIDKFNFDYDVQFSTYAVPMIIGEIQRFIRDDGTVKVPRTIKELANKIHREGLTKELPEVIIEKLELGSTSVGYVNVALRYLKENGGKVLSTEETVYENDGDPITLADMMDGDVNGANWLDRMAVREAIAGLEEREKLIVYLRYYRDRTQSETAAELGISQVQVSRLEKSIIAKMKGGFNEEEETVVKPTPKVTKMVIAIGEPKKQEEKETIIMGNNKSPKGNREEAIRLLESTELTYKEIAARTEVPLSTVGGLAGTYRSKAVKNKNRAKNAPRKKSKTTKNKKTLVKKVIPVQSIASEQPAAVMYELGGGEKSPAMKQMEEQGKQLAEHMIRVQAEGMADYVKKMDRGAIQPVTQIGPHKIGYHPEGISITMGEVEEPKAKVEYNFNFNVSGKQVSIDEVITKLDELKTMLSHIPVDAVNFRINVGS